MRKKTFHLLTLLFVVLLQAGYFFYLSSHRLIARDEGFYVYAGQLVFEGKRLYLDFFYPQMPGIPYLYGAWMELVGFDWYSARAFSALGALLTGSLLYLSGRQAGGVLIGYVAALLYCSSSLAFPWFTTVQTYTFSAAFLLIAVLLLQNDSRRMLLICLSGVALGLATNCRLYMIGLLPIFLLHLRFGQRKQKGSWTACFWFLIGLSFALLPNLYYCLIDFDAYWYNNLDYHFRRSGQTFTEGLPKRQRVFQVLSGLAQSVKFDGYQYAALFWIWILGLFGHLFRRTYPGLASLVLGALFLLCLLPTPTYVQYFSVTVPLLVLVVIQMIGRASSLLSSGQGVRMISMIALNGLLLGYLWYWPKDIDRYTRTGKGVIGIGTNFARDWTVAHVDTIPGMVNAATARNASLLSYWPGFLLGTHIAAVPGTENHFGRDAARHLDDQERSKYLVLANRQMIEVISKGESEFVLIYDQVHSKRLKNALVAGNYQLVKKRRNVRLYGLKGQELSDQEPVAPKPELLEESGNL